MIEKENLRAKQNPLNQIILLIEREDRNRKLNFMPKTLLGKWSIYLITLFFLLLATGMFVISAFEQRGGGTFFDNPVISIPMLGAGASAIAVFLTGAISIWKYKERSIFVFVATLIGLFVLIFVLGEILLPH